jgi:G3E family GTPase
MSADNSRIPVTVLTGFLGSGKTTLLNSLLSRPHLRDTAVIVNELGDIGFDHLLVARSVDNVVLLDSGCLCCAVLDSLKETLADLYYRRARAEVPPFRRVLIETTGLADPAPLLQILLRDSFVSYYFTLAAVVTTLDAVLGLGQLQEHPESVKQAALADRIVITKTDIASNDKIELLRQSVAALNPQATVHVALSADFRLEDVLLGSAATPGAAISDVRPGSVCSEPSNTSRHAGTIRAQSFFIPRSIDWAGLAGWTELIRSVLGARMLRCKGLLQIHGLDGPVLVQGVQGVFAPPVRLPEWPSDDHRARLVCITQHVDRELLEASLAALYAEPGTFPPATFSELLTRTQAQ